MSFSLLLDLACFFLVVFCKKEVARLLYLSLLSLSSNHEGSKKRIYQKKGASRHIENKDNRMRFSLSRKAIV